LLLLILFAAVVARAGTVLGLDTDYVLHEAYGRAILGAGTPRLLEDPTIYTAPGFHPILHEWGAEALFAALEIPSGAWGPLRLMALLGALVPWLLYRRALRDTGSFWPAMAAWVAAAAGIATGLLVRPHLFSVAAFYLSCELLDRWRRGGDWKRLLPALAAVIVLWTNLHGGGAVLWLPVLLTVFAVTGRGPGARLLPLLYALTLLNPWGADLHRHVVRFLFSAAPGTAADMGPPDLRSGTLLVLLALGVALLQAWRRRFRPAPGADVAVAVAALAAACLSMRNLPFLGIAMARLLPPVLAGWLAERPDLDRRSRALAAPARAWIGWALALLALVPLPAVPRPEPRGAHLPAAATAWLRAHPEIARGHGYTDYDDAGFLLHAGVVDRVYLHSLNANTPLALARDRLTIDGGRPGWQDLFARHEVAWALVRLDEPLVSRLDAAGWRRAWSGEERALLLHP
jgi:hypothetical protein